MSVSAELKQQIERYERIRWGQDGDCGANDVLAAIADMVPKVEAIEAEITNLKATAEKLWEIAASSIDPPERRRILDRLGMDSFAEDG